ncbi:hypothetical protein PR048_032451 [Dryococelus australis]|uniref:Uncharacterized protein n=1 Tax=Dryococelus australis TaxID=614101 RepID=A0ABQ9G572_9NEOP|nr:hypothetical protein PR048_032451 [Dryococelus australis]
MFRPILAKNAKSKYRNRIRRERASQKQSSDTHKIPNDRVKRRREHKINIKASERVNAGGGHTGDICKRRVQDLGRGRRGEARAELKESLSQDETGTQVAFWVHLSFLWAHVTASEIHDQHPPLPPPMPPLLSPRIPFLLQVSYFIAWTRPSLKRHADYYLVDVACVFGVRTHTRLINNRQVAGLPLNTSHRPASRTLHCLIPAVAEFPSAGHFSSSIARNSATHSHINSNSSPGPEAFRSIYSVTMTISQWFNAPRVTLRERVAAWLMEFCTPDAYKRGSAKGDRDMRITFLIASTRKALKWRAVLPSITCLYWLDNSRPTYANGDSRTGSLPYFLTWESCWTMLLFGGFPRWSPVSPTLTYRRCSIVNSRHPHRFSRPRC